MSWSRVALLVGGGESDLVQLVEASLFLIRSLSLLCIYSLYISQDREGGRRQAGNLEV